MDNPVKSTVEEATSTTKTDVYHALIFEYSLRGHRANYVRQLAESLLEIDGVKVTVACPTKEWTSIEANTFLDPIRNRIDSFDLGDLTRPSTQRGFAKLKLEVFASCVRESGCNHVYVPYADGLCQAWGSLIRPDKLLPQEVMSEGLIMRGAFAYPMSSSRRRIRAKISKLAQQRASWSRLHYLDPLVFKQLKASSNPNRKIRLMPEAIETPILIGKRAAREKLGIDQDRFVISCPGTVKENKGIDQIIRAFLDLANQRPTELLLWGSHSPSIRKQIEDISLKSKVNKLTSKDQFATEEEFDLLFQASDLICVCYQEHIGSASILLRAAAYGNRVLATDWGWIGWTTKRFGIGTTCDCTNTASLRDALMQEIERPVEAIKESTSKNLVEEMLHFHSIENHRTHWTDLLNQKLGRHRKERQHEPYAQILSHPNDRD